MMKVALAHDYLVNRGGAERVTLALHRIWPDAPLYTALYRAGDTFDEFERALVRVSSLQRIDRGGEFRRLLPLFGRAFRSMRIDDADVLISSSSAFAHHLRGRRACHIAYMHSPPRFLWDERYDHRALTPRWAMPLLGPTLSALRRADLRAVAAVHTLVANGARTAAAIARIYGREPTIVHPPVDTHRFEATPPAGEQYLMVGRLLAHRNQHLAVQAFTDMKRRLVVVGDGPERAALESIAGPTVEFAGVLDEESLARAYRDARAVIVPGEEDLGIVALEANASGRPVVALGAGGALETVVDGWTGVLFQEETPEAIAAAVERADALTFDLNGLRANAERFSFEVFADRMRALVAASKDCARCASERA